ncbi:hypothetical protein ACFL4W_02970 [Planctomycetota bacterium]
MELDLLDINIALGTPAVPQDSENGFFRAEEEILAEMARFEIQRGVVRHVFGKEYTPVAGNQQLAGLESKALMRCDALLPHYTGEMGSFNDEEIIEKLQYQLVKFVTFYPETHKYHFSSHTCGALLHGLSEAGMVVLMEKDEIEYERVHEICTHIPELHLILMNIAYRDNRDIYPLLEETENLCIGISRFCGKDFIEDVSRKFGPERLVFGSNMPIYTAGGPLTSLVYADISEDAKRMIAGNNVRSMLGEIDEH